VSELLGNFNRFCILNRAFNLIAANALSVFDAIAIAVAAAFVVKDDFLFAASARLLLAELLNDDQSNCNSSSQSANNRQNLQNSRENAGRLLFHSVIPPKKLSNIV
jgi:hypothetical protein